MRVGKWLIGLGLLVLLVGCGSGGLAPVFEADKKPSGGDAAVPAGTETNEEPVVSNEELMLLVQDFAMNEAPPGYEIMDLRGASLTGKLYHDFVIIFKKQGDPFSSPIVKGYLYEKGAWSSFSILDEGDYAGPSLSFEGSHSFIDPKKEEFILTEMEGSGGFLGVYVIGSKDGETLELLMETSGYSGGRVRYENRVLIIDDQSKETRFQWNKDQQTFIEG